MDTKRHTSLKHEDHTGQFTTYRKPPILGVTKDGVKILRPRHKPTNFTRQEVHDAVAKALSQSA
jgi:hypothetical protein